jgi:hypothetical protein
MKIIRRSKVNAVQELFEHVVNNRPYVMDSDEVEDLEELELIQNYYKSISSIRESGGIFVDENFSEEESINTFAFVEHLQAEEYEKLIGYKVIEDENN